MEQSYQKIAAAGLRPVAVGLGEPKHVRHFCGKLAPHLTCHVDLDKTAYQKYGLKKGGFMAMMNPAVFVAGTRAAAAGHIQGEATGDISMLPGTFIVDADGVIQFAYYSTHAGDHPEIKKMLQV